MIFFVSDGEGSLGTATELNWKHMSKKNEPPSIKTLWAGGKLNWNTTNCQILLASSSALHQPAFQVSNYLAQPALYMSHSEISSWAKRLLNCTLLNRKLFYFMLRTSIIIIIEYDCNIFHYLLLVYVLYWINIIINKNYDKSNFICFF